MLPRVLALLVLAAAPVLAQVPSSSSSETTEEEQRKRVEEFYGRNDSELKKLGDDWRRSLGESALFRSLAGAGRLEQASVTQGPPAGVAFPVTVGGRRMTAAYLPAVAQPPSPERVVLLEQAGRAFPVDAAGLMSERPQAAFESALHAQPVPFGQEGTIDSGGRLSGSALAKNGEAALGRARETAGVRAEPAPAARPPQRTPYGTRYFDGAGPGEELYSRDVGGQTLFLRYNKDGLPTATHVWSGGEWKPVAGELPAAQRQPFTQEVGGTVYTYRLGADGAGQRTHQLVRAEDGAQGWFKLAGNKPMEARDLPLARQVVSAEARVEAERRAAEARRDRGLYGARAYPRVAAMAAAQLGPAPAPLSFEEVQLRAGGDSARVPGTNLSAATVLPGQGKDPPRRQMLISAGDESDGARLQAALEAYKRQLTIEGGRLLLTGGLGDLLHGGPTPQRLLTPDRVTIALAPGERLQRELAAVNRDLANAPYVAAGQGALESGQSGRGERALANPGVFGVRGRVAARRVSGSAAANSGRAQAEMQAAREQAAGLAATGLWAGRARAALEAAQQFRANGIQDVEVLALRSRDDETRLRQGLGSTGAAVPYRLEGGGSYIHRLSVPEASLPRPGHGTQVAAAVDAQLARLAYHSPSGLSRSQVEQVWTQEIRRIYRVDEASARASARAVLGW